MVAQYHYKKRTNIISVEVKLAWIGRYESPRYYSDKGLPHSLDVDDVVEDHGKSIQSYCDNVTAAALATERY